ncbi:hypothetical protein [Qipengyuania qiaonensis]|uniref:MarR family transcriptional regulator n=1 Tax=Qipengyuania qiaonensis TaxID=2867240 RepID=A0ABS7J790_9SPHN|nr:hypothetical protein [Qipengyuania qiaonensis]MBX7483188.1 hypothetical protein [Qipengyuania qiaonensis]
MTPVERALDRCIAAKLISFAEWERSLRSVRASDTAELMVNSDDSAGLPTSSKLFDEPMWGMLIYLFVTHANGRSASLAGCCRVAGVSRSSGLQCVATLVEDAIVVFNGNLRKAENPNLVLSVKGKQIVEEAMRNFVATRSDENFASAACMPVSDSRLNERIARELKISLGAVAMHRANMAATND